MSARHLKHRPNVDSTPQIEARIRFLRAEAGGKNKSVASGYRAQVHSRGRDWDAVHEYPGVAQVAPGESARARLRFLSPKEHRSQVEVGMPFQIREGGRGVGRGVVTQVLAP
jgi:translation elongation factor EF-Tu-like GTPase